MGVFSKAIGFGVVAIWCTLLSGKAMAIDNIDEMVVTWQKLNERIQNLRVPAPDLTKVIYRKVPFEYVEAIEITDDPKRLPIRGFAFDLPKSRIVIIQNLFDTAGGSLSDLAKLQFSKMLRSLLPRPALQRAFEIEVRGFTDIQTFGDPVNLKNCNINRPNNNACLGKARAHNTTSVLRAYVQQTLGSALPLIQKYDPDPLMLNLNIQSGGKVWTATGAEDNARQIAKLFDLEPYLDHEISESEILLIRQKASIKARRMKQQIESVLQPFRCAIVIAWRS